MRESVPRRLCGIVLTGSSQGKAQTFCLVISRGWLWGSPPSPFGFGFYFIGNLLRKRDFNKETSSWVNRLRFLEMSIDPPDGWRGNWLGKAPERPFQYWRVLRSFLLQKGTCWKSDEFRKSWHKQSMGQQSTLGLEGFFWLPDASEGFWWFLQNSNTIPLLWPVVFHSQGTMECLVALINCLSTKASPAWIFLLSFLRAPANTCFSPQK